MDAYEHMRLEFLNLSANSLSLSFRKRNFAGAYLLQIIDNMLPVSVVVSVDIYSVFIFSQTKIAALYLFSADGIGIENDLDLEFLVDLFWKSWFIFAKVV